MIKRILKNTFAIFLLSVSYNTTFAAAGALFKVTSTDGVPVSITLCLNINGQSPLSCQNYSTQAGALTINTTIPNHTIIMQELE